MRRVGLLFAVLGLGLFLAGTATAGHIEVVYDLTGSTMTTTALGGSVTNIDPISGTIEMWYNTGSVVSTGAPLLGAKLMGGNTHVTISQTGIGTMVVTGSSNTVMLPGPGGLPFVTIGVPGLLVPTGAVPDSAVTGFIHCNGSPTLCGLAGFPFPSIPLPQTPTGPGPFPAAVAPLMFYGGVWGSGGFASGALTITRTSPSPLTLVYHYVGTEISRIAVPEPGSFMLFALAFGGLAGAGVFARRRG